MAAKISRESYKRVFLYLDTKYYDNVSFTRGTGPQRIPVLPVSWPR